MSPTTSNHVNSMNNNNNDAAFYKMLELRLTYYLKHGEDHPDYVDNFNGDAPPQESLPVADVAPQVNFTDLLNSDWDNPPPNIVDARNIAESTPANPGVTHFYNGPPVIDMESDQYNSSRGGSSKESSLPNANISPSSILHARAVVGSTPGNAGEMHVYHAPPVIDLEKDQYNPSRVGTSIERPMAQGSGARQLYHASSVLNLENDLYTPSRVGTSNERPVANATLATQGRVDPTTPITSRQDSQNAEGRSQGSGNAKPAHSGEVRDSLTSNGIEYRDPRSRVWSPAVRHADIRKALLQEADYIATQYGDYGKLRLVLFSEGPGKLTSYWKDFPPASGHDRYDRTSFVPAHKTWGPERPNRPEINFVFEKPKTPLPLHMQPDTKPKQWIWHGLVVLDHNDKPMRDFDDCPTTLASCVEGFRIDAILKRNPQMESLDLWGRLPPHHTTFRSDSSLKIVPVVTLAGLNNVAMRWRFEACVLSFTRRRGSDDTRNFLSQFLTPQQLAANTTRGRQDLTKTELAELFEYKKAADSAKKNGQDAPAIPRRVNHVESPLVVSPGSATAAQAASPVGPLMSDSGPIFQVVEPVDPLFSDDDWVKKVFNGSVDDAIELAAELLVGQVDARGRKRQLDETIDSGDPDHLPRGNSSIAPRDRAMPEYGSPSLSNFEGPPTKKRRGTSMVNDTITQNGSQERQIGLVQVRSPDSDNSRAGSYPRHNDNRRLPPFNNHDILRRGTTQYVYPDHLAASPKNRKIVPPGFRHAIYPVGTAIILFCPDDTVVQQGIIAGEDKTAWHEQKIPDTIRTVRAMNASLQLSHPAPSEVFRNVQTSSTHTEPYSYDLPEGFESLIFPIGRKVVCIYPHTKEIVGGVIAADGQTLWRRLSAATTIDLLENMDRNVLNPQR
ncbi:MAG: hypothetical protein Q9195_001177 [Heterodermia aff. obscurata]